MASTDARLMPTKNTAYRVTFPIYDNTGNLVSGASGLDSEVSIDGGTFADCTNEATEIATASGIYYLDLTSGEMNGDTIAVLVKTSTTDARTTVLVFYPNTLSVVQIGANAGQVGGQTASASGTVTFPNATLASTTNITAGTVTTVTNLTNAPTAGDFTATMKSSLNAATPASVVGAVGSVTGNVGGNVTGSVGSVVGNVGGNVTGSVGSLATQAKTDVENATWNATLASHLNAGSTGEALSEASAGGDPDAIAVAVLTKDYTAIPDGDISAKCLLQSSRSPLNGFNITPGSPPVLNVLKEDETTTAYSLDLTTDPNAEPIIGAS